MAVAILTIFLWSLFMTFRLQNLFRRMLRTFLAISVLNSARTLRVCAKMPAWKTLRIIALIFGGICLFLLIIFRMVQLSDKVRIFVHFLHHLWSSLILWALFVYTWSSQIKIKFDAFACYLELKLLIRLGYLEAGANLGWLWSAGFLVQYFWFDGIISSKMSGISCFWTLILDLRHDLIIVAYDFMSDIISWISHIWEASWFGTLCSELGSHGRVSLFVRIFQHRWIASFILSFI